MYNILIYFLIHTVIAGDINIVSNEEYVFSLFLILNGSLYYAFLISSISSLISNKDVTTKMFRSDLAKVCTLLQVRDTPEALRMRINSFFQHSLVRQCGCNENSFLNDIPVSLLKEIKHSYSDQLRILPFFSSLSDSFIELCVERLTYRTYVPGSVIFFQNERGHREAILVESGRIDLTVQSEKETLYSYVAGDAFGDFQLIFGTVNEVTAQASTFTEVMVLCISSFSDAIRVLNLEMDISADHWLARQGDALRSTIESHKRDLEKFLVVQTSISETRRHKAIFPTSNSTLHGQKKSKIYVLPNSFFRPLWASCSLIGMTYFSLAIPIRILVYWQCPFRSTSSECLSSWDTSLVIDYLWDIFFLVDIILHCFLYCFEVFEDDRHVLVSEWRRIAKRFSTSPSVVVYALAALPLDFFAIRWGYLLVLRLSKLLWVLLVFDRINTILYYCEHYSARKQALLGTQGITVLHLSIVTFLVMLWTAIAWAILRNEVDKFGIIASLYWAMTTMTTVGYGDIIPETNSETLFVVLFCIIGPSCSATIIANAASFLNSTNMSIDNIGHRQYVIETYLRSVMVENEHDLAPPSIFSSESEGKYESPFGHKLVHPESEMKKKENVPAPAPLLSRSGSIGAAVSGFTSFITASFKKRSALHDELSDQAMMFSQVMAYLDYMKNEKRGLDETKLTATLLPDYMQHSLKQAMVVDLVIKLPFFAKCDSGFIRGVMMVSFFDAGGT